MKKIKYTFLALFIAAGLFTSCSDDDETTIDITTVDLNATVGFLGNAVASGSQLAYTVTLGQSFASDATVRVELEYDDTGVATNDVVLPAGSTSLTGIMVAPGTEGVSFNLDPTFNSATLKAIGVVLSEPNVGEAFNVVSNEVAVPLHEVAPDISSEQFNILFDWSNPAGNDLDLYVFETTTFALASTSFTGSRFEPGQILLDAPDGTYGVNAEVWSNADTTIDYKFMYRNTTGELVMFTGTWDGVSGGDFLAPEPFITITKTGDTFTINQ